MEPSIEILSSLITPIGVAAIFVWLYINEKRTHEETRRYYWSRLDDERTAHERTRMLYRDDLREIAGMRQHLNSVQRVVDRARSERDTQEMNIPRLADTGPLAPD